MTRAEDAAAALPDLAQGHVVLFGRRVSYDEPDGFTAGSAGVVTTATDMARWLRFHAGHPTTGADHVLWPALVETAHIPPATIGSDYAMGSGSA